MRTLFLILAFLVVNNANAGPSAINQGPPGGDFMLHSSSGPVSLQSMRGKAVLLFFGYTFCPDVCPNTLNFVADILNTLETHELQYLETFFITIDPERDTPSRMQTYTHYFHEKIIGLTGTVNEIEHVAELYGVQKVREVLPKSEITYAFSHSAALYLIMPNGELRFIFPQNASEEDVLKAIKQILALIAADRQNSP